MTKLEEAAKAAYEECRSRFKEIKLMPWEDENEFLRGDWLAYMKAAIGAMREPNNTMRHAGADTYGVHSPTIGYLPLETLHDQPTKAWQAMIDAMLAEKS